MVSSVSSTQNNPYVDMLQNNVNQVQPTDDLKTVQSGVHGSSEAQSGAAHGSGGNSAEVQLEDEIELEMQEDELQQQFTSSQLNSFIKA